MKLLLATHDPSLRLSLEMLLGEEPGVAIVGTASEGAGLLALIQTTSPDMVIADWGLPGRPMPETLAQAQNLPSPPIFILLGKDAARRDQALQAGAHAYLLTGDSPEQLLYTFRRLRIRLQQNSP